MRRRRTIQWLFVPAVCVLLGFLFAIRQYLMMIQKREPIAWAQALTDQLPYWLLWAAVSPVTLWLDGKFPIQRQRWVRAFLVHMTASVFFALAQAAVYVWLVSGLLGDFDNTPYPFTGETAQAVLASGAIPGMVFYWVILAINLAFKYHQQYQEEALKGAHLNTQLAEARLRALRMQLHPHFLFNTLHSVAALVLKNDNRGAVRMLNRLSSLLRLTLDGAETQEVTLRRELELLELYLEIERIRFQDRLTVAMEIEPQTLAAWVPNFILQPLVENAVRHGVAADSSATRIEIRANRQNGMLYLEVRDDGPGLSESSADESAKGVGLRNTRSRLSELYGEDQDFEVRNGTERGVVASITLPFNTEPTTADAPPR